MFPSIHLAVLNVFLHLLLTSLIQQLLFYVEIVEEIQFGLVYKENTTRNLRSSPGKKDLRPFKFIFHSEPVNAQKRSMSSNTCKINSSSFPLLGYLVIYFLDYCFKPQAISCNLFEGYFFSQKMNKSCMLTLPVINFFYRKRFTQCLTGQ